jgi:hypothetical protein
MNKPQKNLCLWSHHSIRGKLIIKIIIITKVGKNKVGDFDRKLLEGKKTEYIFK